MSDPHPTGPEISGKTAVPGLDGPSVLFRHTFERERAEVASRPECFADLLLDRIVGSILAGRDAYELKPFYYAPLRNTADVEYRQAVMRDLERPEVVEPVKRFGAMMHQMRSHLDQAARHRNAWQERRERLDAVLVYCQAVDRLQQALCDADPSSAGLTRVGEYLDRHVSSSPFVALRNKARALDETLTSIRYEVFIDGLRVLVRRADEEVDYGKILEATFAPFRGDGDWEPRFKLHESPDLNPVEERILERIAELWPEAFSRLAEFVESYREFIDPTVSAFDREIQFYLAYQDYRERFRKAGLEFCQPRVKADKSHVFARNGFELAVAEQLLGEEAMPVPNDFELKEGERVIIVTGPNQSGKTTFARLFGQLHFLASLGLPVPASRAQLFLGDGILTHFERGEATEDGRGKLQDELIRVHEIMTCATPDSMVILNELFGSTTVRDASLLGRRILTRLEQRDLLAVWVTFLDELAEAGSKTVSMAGEADPDDRLHRTFRIVRRDPDGLAYALALAESHGLTTAMLRERLPR